MEANIQIIAEERLKQIVENGTLESLIEKQLIKTTESIVSDLFRDYSEFGKELKKVLTEKMNISLTSINIPEYTTAVCNSIEGALKGTVMEQALEKINSHIKQVCGVLEKTEWKLSEVVQIYRDSLYGENPRVDIEIKEESYGMYVYLGERKESSSSYSYRTTSKAHEITLHLNKKNNQVYAVTNHGIPLDPRTTNLSMWETFCMKLWAQECVIVIDEDEAQEIADNESYD